MTHHTDCLAADTLHSRSCHWCVIDDEDDNKNVCVGITSLKILLFDLSNMYALFFQNIKRADVVCFVFADGLQ